MPSSTVIGLGREYIAAHQQDTMFTRGAWYRYHTGAWQVINPLYIEKEIWAILEEHEKGGDFKSTGNTHASVVKYVKSQLFIPQEQVDSTENENLVNMTNGVLKTNEGNLYPHNPGYYMTTQLPFDYDPSACAPTWDYYLESALVYPGSNRHDPSEACFLQEAVGYSLSDSVAHEATFWCFGRGSNGKGVLFHVLENLSGTAFTALNFNTMKRDQYQLADLVGKRLALCSESNVTDEPLEDALIKSLISGDLIKARQIYGEPFAFKSKAKLWWSMNHLPVVVDSSDGFFRRLNIIPFNQKFERSKDLSLREKLLAELPGIFNWAIEGWRRLQQRGHFTECKQIVEATRIYRRESNTIQMFIDERCEVKLGLLAAAAPLYDDYKAWSYQFNYRPYSYRSFKRGVENLGYYCVHQAQGNFYSGLKLKP